MNRVKVKVGDGVALSGPCFGELVVALLRALLLLKGQIPVAWDALSALSALSAVSAVSARASSVSSALYSNTLSTAITNIDTLFKNILLEFKGDDLPVEVLIIFGSSTIFAKEIYKIVVPEGLHSHYGNNHTAERHKRVTQILRDLMFSDLQDVLHVPLPLTNTFVVIKKRNLEDGITFDHDQVFSDFFLPLDSFQIPQNVKQTVVQLEYQSDLVNCCSNLKIFNDSTSPPGPNEEVIDCFENLSLSDSRTEEYCFLQSKITFKGFKHPDGKSL